MKRVNFFFPLLITIATTLYAQTSDIDISSFIDKKFSVNLTTRILGTKNETIWHMDSSDVTISGEAVKVKLKSDKLVIIANITPYINPDDTILLIAKGEIFLKDSSDSSEINYYTTLKSIPVNLGEKVIFFPLGSATDDDGDCYSIEMEIQVLSVMEDN